MSVKCSVNCETVVVAAVIVAVVGVAAVAVAVVAAIAVEFTSTLRDVKC